MLTAGLCSAVNIPKHPAPEIIFLDVGQGDSTLIRLPNRQEILMDGGGTPFAILILVSAPSFLLSRLWVLMS